jgi:Tfp pilus assembly protein FimV
MSATIAAPHRTIHAAVREGRQRRAARRAAERRDLVAAIVCALVAGAFLLAVGTIPALTKGQPRAESTHLVRVGPSDTLWDIARANAVPGATTAQTVAAIRQLNHLETAEIHAGSLLAVPSAQTPETAFAER